MSERRKKRKRSIILVNKTSIIVDASKYIEELKGKVERLSQDVASSQSSNGQNSLPMKKKMSWVACHHTESL
ncbi:hypothetical protein CsSME_00034531 [Camellia sinensis var. sinensis]